LIQPTILVWQTFRRRGAHVVLRTITDIEGDIAAGGAIKVPLGIVDEL
jgi:hypothetical protein